MNITDLSFMKGFIKIAADGCARGWHERNGGNLTYRLKKSEVEEAKSWFDGAQASWTPIGTVLPALENEYFLVTGTGKFFRNIELCPEENIGICEISPGGTDYRIVWGFTDGSTPTSEFPSHLMNHVAKIKAKGDSYRIIYHCHPANIIALTFVLPLDDKVFTRELWQMITECSIVFPDGVGVMPWMICGGVEIAEKSAELMQLYDVMIWAHHGLFCAGECFDTTFGLADTVEKAAEILLKVMSVSPKKLQTITTQNLRDLAPCYGVKLPERFLDE